MEGCRASGGSRTAYCERRAVTNGGLTAVVIGVLVVAAVAL